MDDILISFPGLTAVQIEQFAALKSLYEDWNSKINVISRKDMDAFYTHHVLHSMAIAKVQPFIPGSRILDVGTGGGFPGIPLAILFPETRFLLVDSIGKKIKVVSEIAEVIGLQNVEAKHLRAEDVRGRFDFVVSRAVTRMAPFLNWVHDKFEAKSNHSLSNGILYLKGGDLQDELAECRKPYTIYPIANFFHDPYFETKVVVHVRAH